VTDSPRLSVVILTYNSADTIGECLDSLASQRYQDFDVIVVDDDSKDETLAIVSEYSARMKITVVRNGAHNIPRGRNIGINSAQSDIVAFLDSDDCATPDWTQVIVDTFREHPETALIGGLLAPGYRTDVARAISLNDYAIRRLFPSDLLHFSGGNSALNIKMLQGVRYNEDFKFGEDLELAARVTESGVKRYVPEMIVQIHSRTTFGQYARQMYRYGFMKVWVSFAAKSFRLLDVVPLALLLGGVGASLALLTWWPLLLNIPFALAEAVFVVCYQRCPARIALLTFPAWLVKNLSWSAGLGSGLVALAVNGDARRVVRRMRQ
jgi:glycosyltransferase involved in cell wall biosynthesis